MLININKVQLLLFSFLFMTNYLLSQSFTLKGTVLNKEREGIEFANVIVLTQDSSYLFGTITDQLGLFEFKTQKGGYILEISRIGYKSVSLAINITKDTVLGVVSLDSTNTLLKEIIVTAKSQIIRRDLDRLIIDAKSLSPGNNNAIDVLRNVPGIVITNDKVSIIGKGEVVLLIDGKEQKITGGEILNFLKTFKASELNRIEVITTPPAKYDAEGEVGLLNIVLNRARQNYLGGSLSYSQNFSKYTYGDIGGSLMFSKKKISSFLNVGGSLGHSGYMESNIKNYSLEYWSSNTDSKDDIFYLNLRGGIDYQPNENLSFGILFSFFNNKPNQYQRNDTKICSIESSFEDSLIASRNSITKKTERSSINLHIDKKIGGTNKLMRFDIDFINYMVEKIEDFNSIAYKNTSSILSNYSYDSENGSHFKAISSSLDIILPFQKYTLGFGCKGSFANTESNVNYLNSNFLEDQENIFSYDEDIFSIYTDFSKTITEKISYRAGVRLEYTETKGKSEKSNDLNNHSYFRFFPTFSYGYKYNANHSFNIGLTSRIQRPGFNRVNPFKLYENQFSIISGNPNLKPTEIYSLNLGYTYKNNFNIDAYYIFKDNVFSQLVELDSTTKVTLIRWDNFLTSHSWGFTNSYTLNNDKRIQSFLQYGGYYSRSISNSELTLKERDGFVFTCSVNNTLSFNTSKTFLGQISLNYTSAQYTAASVSKPYYDIDSRISYSKGKLKYGFSIYNILETHTKGTVNSNGLNMRYNNKYSYRSFIFNISYNFGAKINVKQRKLSNSDLMNRL